MNKFYTYAFLREDKTPYYIGKGTGNRIYRTTRRRRVKPPKDKSRIIYLKKNLTEEEAFKHEIYMIAVFGRKDLGTGILINGTDGGEGCSGLVQSDESRKKISESKKGNTNCLGKTHSEETKKRISEAQKGEKNHNYGKTASEETKKKQSEVKKGRTASEETKKRMSDRKKGKNHHFYGKTHSEETKKRMSDLQKGRTASEETKKRMSDARKGKKWWNDGCGNRKRMLECPGNDWKPGRK